MLCALHHLFVGLREFSAEAVHMHVIDTGEAPERLVGLKADAERGMARERAVTVAMTVDHQIRAASQGLDGREPAPVQAGHDAASALLRHKLRMPAHGV